MRQVTIADGRGRRRDILAGVAFESSGGLPPAWSAALCHLPRRGRVLDYGSWQGLAALWLAAATEARVTFAHFSATLLAQVGRNARASSLRLTCRAMFPLEGAWDTLVLAAPEQSEALAMLAAQGAARLAPGGELLVVDGPLRRESLARAFTRVEVLAQEEGWSLARCTGPRSGEGLPWRRLAFDLGDLELEMASLPGTFSPQGLDLGSRVLLETAVIPPGGRVLDLGCGWGGVGAAAAKLGAGAVVWADDCLIALKATRYNLEKLGLPGQVVHCSQPREIPGKFAAILSNPPYHADYGTAKSFIEYAGERLAPGGWLYLVVKKPDWYRQKLRAVFGGSTAQEKQGYFVLGAQKRPPGAISPPAATTRKHARRQQAAAERRRRIGGD